MIVTCDCGQQNRLPATVPPGKICICGACKAELLDDDDNDDSDDEDEDDQ